MRDKPLFSVNQEGAITKFVNNSDMDLWVSLVPIKPKRRYSDICVVPSGEFRIYDHSPIDLTKVSFRLINKQ